MATDRTVARIETRRRLREQQELARTLSLGEQSRPVIDELAQLAVAERIIHDGINSRVVQARAAGLTWNEIGAALEMTAQGAAARHARALRDA